MLSSCTFFHNFRNPERHCQFNRQMSGHKLYYEKLGGTLNFKDEGDSDMSPPSHHVSFRNFNLKKKKSTSSYMELGSYFLFLQEQIKDIIIITVAGLITGMSPSSLSLSVLTVTTHCIAAPLRVAPHCRNLSELICPLMDSLQFWNIVPNNLCLSVFPIPLSLPTLEPTLLEGDSFWTKPSLHCVTSVDTVHTPLVGPATRPHEPCKSQVAVFH